MDNPSQETIALMRALVAKARCEPSFVAYALQEYMSLFRMGEEELRRMLGCSEVGLLRLALCARPDVGSEEFRREVRRCAEYAGADVVKLANLFRTVANREAIGDKGIAAARPGEVLACSADSSEPWPKPCGEKEAEANKARRPDPAKDDKDTG